MHSSPSTGNGLKGAVLRRGSLVQTFKAVAWSFFGVRRSRDNEVDFKELNPLYVVFVGIFSAAVFIASLLVIVGFVAGASGH